MGHVILVYIGQGMVKLLYESLRSESRIRDSRLRVQPNSNFHLEKEMTRAKINIQMRRIAMDRLKC